jgi:hypothetical protein
MFTLCTDSPNIITSLRERAVSSGEFVFAFGCAPHGLNNLCMDCIKFHVPKMILGRVAFMVKGINNVHLLSALFEKICVQKLDKVYSRIAFSPSRWSTSTFALRRKCKSVLVAMPHDLDFVEEYSSLKDKMSDELRSEILSPGFWKGTVNLYRLLKPVTVASGNLEGEDSTLSCVYACFLGISYHVHVLLSDTLSVLQLNRESLIQAVYYIFKTIYTPAHALAFVTDPLFFDMPANLTCEYQAAFLGLGQGSLLQQCRKALQMRARGDQELNEKLQEFATFMAT